MRSVEGATPSQLFDGEQDERERRTNLVIDVGEDARARLLGFFEGAHGRAELRGALLDATLEVLLGVEQLGVRERAVQGERDGGHDRVGEVFAFFSIGAGAIPQGHRADGRVTRLERANQAGRPSHVAMGRHIRRHAVQRDAGTGEPSHRHERRGDAFERASEVEVGVRELADRVRGLQLRRLQRKQLFGRVELEVALAQCLMCFFERASSTKDREGPCEDLAQPRKPPTARGKSNQVARAVGEWLHGHGRERLTNETG